MREVSAHDLAREAYAVRHIEICLYADPGAVSRAELVRATRAFQIQIDEHFSRVWDVYARLKIVDELADVGDSWLLHVTNAPSPNGDKGDHVVGPNGRPLGFVYMKEVNRTLVDGKALPWTVTASHEILEMLVNPYVTTATYLNAQQTGVGFTPRLFAMFEVVDPCQYDWYDIAGVTVGDFVHPAWFFGTDAHPGPFDHLGRIAAPRTLSPTRRIGADDLVGYAWMFDPAGAAKPDWVYAVPPKRQPDSAALVAANDAPARSKRRGRAPGATKLARREAKPKSPRAEA